MHKLRKDKVNIVTYIKIRDVLLHQCQSSSYLNNSMYIYKM